MQGQDNLFAFIKTLSVAEKRKFKLFASKSDGLSSNLYVQLFNTLDKMVVYDERVILKKNKEIKATQLANLKVHLYKIILTCLRLIEKEKIKSIEIREDIDYAKILYNKGLYKQSLKLIERTKGVCEIYHEYFLLFEILELEKNIELRHITGSSFGKADALIEESDKLVEKVVRESSLTNLCLGMYGLYLRVGLVQNKVDAQRVSTYFNEAIKRYKENGLTFIERVHFYQAYTWYAYMQQDFLKYYRYAQKWANCYEGSGLREEGFFVEDYFKAKHHLFNALFFLSHGVRLGEEIVFFEEDVVKQNLLRTTNLQSQYFVDMFSAKLNLCFLRGNFTQTTVLIPEIEEGLERYKHQLDNHKILIFYYKIAATYFGCGDYERCIDYLNKIIHLKIGEIRTDLQCFARMLHLVAHFELDNYGIIDYLIKSLYRFLLKHKNNSKSMLLIISFLKEAIKGDRERVMSLFKKLLKQLKGCLDNPYERRTFLYLDLISYLECKISGRPIHDIIREKYERREKRF